MIAHTGCPCARRSRRSRGCGPRTPASAARRCAGGPLGARTSLAGTQVAGHGPGVRASPGRSLPGRVRAERGTHPAARVLRRSQVLVAEHHPASEAALAAAATAWTGSAPDTRRSMPKPSPPGMRPYPAWLPAAGRTLSRAEDHTQIDRPARTLSITAGHRGGQPPAASMREELSRGGVPGICGCRAAWTDGGAPWYSGRVRLAPRSPAAGC